MDTDLKHRRAGPVPRVLIGARVRSSTDPVADGSQRVRGQFGHFNFDYVHDQHSGQEDVFYTTVRPLVHKLIEGKSSAILLYGASKTGKTYTIEGVGAVGGHKEGLVPRAVALLHHLIQTSQHKGSLTVTQSALTTGVTPQLLDLQCPGAAPQKLPQSCDQCNPSHPHLHLQFIRHPNDIFQVLGSGKLVNSLGSPVSCSPSSHNWKGPALPVGPGTAHTILTVAFSRSCCNDMGAPEIAKLHFVELAAPPSKQVRGGEGPKGGLAQAQALSKAYSSLTSVLLALKQQRRKQDQEAASVHIPWRECSLTKWLQEPLSGSSYVVLMGTVAAGSSNAGDTLATLNWLSRFRAEGSSRNEAVWISPDGDLEGSPHCHERRWPPGYMQWREHEHRRLHREGLLTHPQQAGFVDQAAWDHCCGTECQAPEEDEEGIAHKRELVAARKALKKSLKELDSAEADRSHLQRQVNKLSRTLQVQVTALNREAARIRAHNEVHSAAKRQEYEKQGPARGQTGVKSGVTDLFDSDAESDEEAENSGHHSDGSETSSDSDSLDGSKGRSAHKKLDLTTHKARADTAERNLAAAQDSLADTRQSLDTLQTHHSDLKQHLECAELHSQDSATQAREFAARVKELSADKEALVSELATTALLEESESDSGAKARSPELMWVMKRLCDHFKQSSGAQQQVVAFAADKQSLQDKLSQHLQAAQSSTAAMHAELSALRDKAAMSEAAVTEARKQAQQLRHEVEQVTGEKAQAEQQVGELRAVQGQLELEVARLQHQLQGLEGQLQSEVGQLQGQLQAEVQRLQGQLQQARAEEEEAQEQRHAAKLQLSKFVKELDASTSEVSELESKLSAAQRRIQKQAEEQEEAESARAQQGQQLNALAEDRQTLQSSLERVKQDRQQAYEEAGQAKARLGVCERELSLARQEAEGSGRSGQALSAELHTLGRQNAALQQQLASVQAQLEETLDARQAEGRKRERGWKQAADEHATALLAVEARLAGKQREVAGLQDINARLFSRFQDMREQLARSEDKLSHDKLRGWLDGMVEQFEEARQHNVLHSVLRSDDRWDALQASARRTDSRSPLSGHKLHEEDAGLIAPVRTTSNVYAELSPLQSQKSALANTYLSPARTVSYVPTTPLGKQVAASADAIRRRLLQTPASEARHAASQLESANSVL
ncbi:hypothetical protein WJX79_005071 [Trebouxia sp. C0005]